MAKTELVKWKNLNGRYGGTRHQLLGFDGQVVLTTDTPPFDAPDSTLNPSVEVTPA